MMAGVYEIKRKCFNCGELKLLIEFGLEKTRKYGKGYVCKECKRNIGRKWYKENKEKHAKSVRRWESKNKEKRLEYSKRYRVENRQKNLKYNKQYRIQKREKCTKYALQWQKNHIEKVKEIRKRTYIKRGKTPKGKLNNCIRKAINISLKGNKTGRHWENLVGYDLFRLMRHLEKQFTPRMTWGNHGFYWEIDHIIPIKVLNFERPEHPDFKRCWALKNLRPLEVHKNISKGAKIDKPFQPSLRIKEYNACCV